MIRIERCLGFGVAALALAGLAAGCGGGDSGGGGSFASIQSSIASPSGTVDENTVADVGAEFEKVSSSSSLAMGMRRDAQVAQSSSQTITCELGGSATSSGSGNESSGQVTASYDNCCMLEDCCVDGVARFYYSSDQTASYSFCGSYDIKSSCEGTTADLNFEGCFGSSGEWVYVVEVDGESYAVSGSYANGSGELEITGANGTWTCTYTNDGGSCTGTSGSFDF